MKEFVYLLILLTQDGSELVERGAVYKTDELCQEWGRAFVEDFHFTSYRCEYSQLSSMTVAEAEEYARRMKESLGLESDSS